MISTQKKAGICEVSSQEIADVKWDGVLPLNTAMLNLLAKKKAPIYGGCNPQLSPEYTWYSEVNTDTLATTIYWRPKGGA